jgi:hypothetical protein
MKSTLPLVARTNRPLPPAHSSGVDREPSRDSSSLRISSFRSSIKAFIKVAEAKTPTEFAIGTLLTEFGFQKRRMYDIVSVGTAIGCCQKASVDSIFWMGLSKTPGTFLKIQLDAGADVPTASLDQIIRSENNVSISRLTVCFVLCFLALNESTLEIKHISRYLSRRTNRHKSILCTLYQIAHILEAAGVIHRSLVPGQLTVSFRYFSPVNLKKVDADGNERSPYAIGSILNQSDPVDELVYQKRRSEFRRQGSTRL